MTAPVELPTLATGDSPIGPFLGLRCDRCRAVVAVVHTAAYDRQGRQLTSDQLAIAEPFAVAHRSHGAIPCTFEIEPVK
jgi:hypothetical protein